MLYANEDVKMWDAETGGYVEDSFDKAEEAELKSGIADGRALQSMKTTAGWKLVNTFLTDAVDGYKNKLAFEDDFKKIRRLQETIKAHNNILVFVDWSIQQGKKFENKQTPTKG